LHLKTKNKTKEEKRKICFGCLISGAQGPAVHGSMNRGIRPGIASLCNENAGNGAYMPGAMRKWERGQGAASRRN